MYAGIDLGSRTIGLAVLSASGIEYTKLVDSGFEPLHTARELLPPGCRHVVATGYGRHLAGADFAGQVITEIKAHALGAEYLFPGTRTVLDIGGQDTKVILLDGSGTVIDFQMNDKCSAGTGKFLEVMAGALGYSSVQEFGEDAVRGSGGIKISSMCTVFAESEAVSLVYRGAERKDIARALHSSVAERTASMLKRVGYESPLLFTGGVAHNNCIRKLLSPGLDVEIRIPREPQLVGALGAALSAQDAC